MSEEKLSSSNHFKAYEMAEQFCMERFPKMQQCMDISNQSVDIRECKQLMKNFAECFSGYKSQQYQSLGRQGG